MPGRPSRDRSWLVVVPIALAIAAYARVLDGEFQFDDFSSIVQNAGVKDLSGVPGRFLGALLHGGRPVAELTFALNYAASRLDPWSYHATNLAIHVVAVVLVFFFTRTVLRLAGAARPAEVALFVAGVFALHPLQTQAVSYVVQRAEALASAFYVAALLLLLEAERRGRSAGGLAAYLGAVAAFVLGVGTKPIVATVPATYLLLTAVVPGEEGRAALGRWPTRLAMLAPWLALGGYLASTSLHAVEGTRHAGFAVPGVTAGSYFLTQWLVIPTYLRLLFWPAGQNVDWVFPFVRDLDDPEVLAAGALLTALVVGALALLRAARRWSGPRGAAARVAGFGVLWFFVVLSPSSSVVPLGDALVEHRVYLASWGVFVAVAVASERCVARWAGERMGPVAAAVTAATWVTLAGLAYQRNAVWVSRLALWSDCAVKAPHNWRARMQLGDTFTDRADFEGAIREYQRALEGGGRSTAHDEAYILNSLGMALKHAGRREEAVRTILRSLELNPDDSDAMFNCANLKRELGDRAGAEGLAARAVKAQPTHGPALALLGCLRAERGDAVGALPLLRRAAATDPDQPATQLYIAHAYAQLGRTEEACVLFRRALQLDLVPAARGQVERMISATCR